jgi:hypothetical protein
MDLLTPAVKTVQRSNERELRCAHRRYTLRLCSDHDIAYIVDKTIIKYAHSIGAFDSIEYLFLLSFRNLLIRSEDPKSTIRHIPYTIRELATPKKSNRRFLTMTRVVSAARIPRAPRGFHSDQPGDPQDLPVDASEFINACIMVHDGPFIDENEDWLRVVRMYNRMNTLRIPIFPFCDDHIPRSMYGTGIHREFISFLQAPTESHPFSLPFSVHEFLTICNEAEMDQDFAVPKYAGSRMLFLRMVKDLAIDSINLHDFLADHVPASMEENTVLIRLLASAQGELTQDSKVHLGRFLQLLFAPDDDNGNLVGPLTHFQAAVFVQHLDTVQPTPEVVEHVVVPHRPCDVGIAVEDIVCVRSPCCSSEISRCCLVKLLTRIGPTCLLCGKDRIKSDADHSREK